MSNELTQRDLMHFSDKLRKILGQATGARDQISRESLDLSSRGGDSASEDGTDREFEDVDLDLLAVENSTAVATLAALRRISAGTYGRCEDCDAWIARGRLEALPYASLCLACQQRSEEGRDEEEEN